jgi:hypothetical protein
MVPFLFSIGGHKLVYFSNPIIKLELLSVINIYFINFIFAIPFFFAFFFLALNIWKYERNILVANLLIITTSFYPMIYIILGIKILINTNSLFNPSTATFTWKTLSQFMETASCFEEYFSTIIRTITILVMSYSVWIFLKKKENTVRKTPS